jgi:hypothetical protein
MTKQDVKTTKTKDEIMRAQKLKRKVGYHTNEDAKEIEKREKMAIDGPVNVGGQRQEMNSVN